MLYSVGGGFSGPTDSDSEELQEIIGGYIIVLQGSKGLHLAGILPKKAFVNIEVASNEITNTAAEVLHKHVLRHIEVALFLSN